MKIRTRLGKLRRNPLVIFLLFLGLLFVIIFITSKAREPEDEGVQEEQAKQVVVFDIGEKPTVTTQALVKEAGTIQIISQTGGIISKIHVSEGDEVVRGKKLVSIANNYQGGNAASVQTSIAARQLKNINETFDTQKDLINTQKEIAHKMDENSSELRSIGSESVGGTEDLLDQNKDILTTLEENLEFLEDNNQDGELDDEILALKQGIALQNSQILQIESGLKNTQYSTSDDNPPAELSTLQKDATLKGLELQEKALYMGRDIARLQLVAARIGASIFFPVSPVSGQVEAVHITTDQMVAPGMPLITINNPDSTLTIVAQIPKDLAPFVSSDQNAMLSVDDTEVELTPVYVSTIATQGDQHTVTYTLDYLPDDISLTENTYVTISIPLYGNCQEITSCFIPIESVHQTQELAGVYVVDDEGVARLKEVEMGSIIGSFVEIIEGLETTDRVIVSRNVVDGDRVEL